MIPFIRQTWPSYKINCDHTVAMSASVFKPWGPGALGPWPQPAAERDRDGGGPYM